jgi:deoxycytidine triphosphate deaminase
MIWPFEGSEERLKSASYLVDILGVCIYWDDKGRKRVVNLQRGEELILRPNSIAFVSLEPTFRLPNYIALRFNLEIRHIHKGLLLGTGPLVDPGYVGKLLIPLHNLTANKYIFKGGDHLIWIEFTKLSPNSQWEGFVVEQRKGEFMGFPDYKNYKNNPDAPEYYLEKAVGRGKRIQSSIPIAVEEAKSLSLRAMTTVNEAVTDINKFRNAIESKVNRFTGIISIAGLISVAALTYQFYELVSSTNEYLRNANKETQELRRKIDILQNEIDRLRSEIRAPDDKVPGSGAPAGETGQETNSNKRSQHEAAQKNGNAER